MPRQASSTSPAGHTAAQPIYTAETYSADNSVGLLMRRVILSVVQQADAKLLAHDLTHAQWGPLLRLRQVGPCTPAELARDLQVDAGAMTRMLDRLERKGLCQRERSSSDRRVVHVSLTPEGAANVAHVPGVLAEVLNDHLKGFSHAEWQTLMSLLQRMQRNGEALKGGLPVTPCTDDAENDNT